jgi:hypothetical protein
MASPQELVTRVIADKVVPCVEFRGCSFPGNRLRMGILIIVLVVLAIIALLIYIFRR